MLINQCVALYKLTVGAPLPRTTSIHLIEHGVYLFKRKKKTCSSEWWRLQQRQASLKEKMRNECFWFHTFNESVYNLCFSQHRSHEIPPPFSLSNDLVLHPVRQCSGTTPFLLSWMVLLGAGLWGHKEECWPHMHYIKWGSRQPGGKRKFSAPSTTLPA